MGKSEPLVKNNKKEEVTVDNNEEEENKYFNLHFISWRKIIFPRRITFIYQSAFYLIFLTNSFYICMNTHKFTNYSIIFPF